MVHPEERLPGYGGEEEARAAGFREVAQLKNEDVSEMVY